MQLKKVIAYLLIGIGLFLVYREIQFYHQAKVWEEIHQFGQSVSAKVISVDCEDNDTVSFKIVNRKEQVKLHLESDCILCR